MFASVFATIASFQQIFFGKDQIAFLGQVKVFRFKISFGVIHSDAKVRRTQLITNQKWVIFNAA